MIAVETIQFNYDTNAATHDAMNIRRNATETVTLPEWRRFACVNPEDSPAAYSVVSTKGNVVTIQASFSCTDPAIHSAEIRVPHRVRTQSVNFTNGVSGIVMFELIDPPVTRGHVGVWDEDWMWEYRLPHHFHWHPMMTTRHRIYVVLDIPTAPWDQSPFTSANTQLPWTEVLDRSCDWANGAHTKDQAACFIVENVYSLGPAVVTYDCPGGGASHYSFSGFDCTAFLDLLRGGLGNGIYVNCSDCATILSTFANLLGCDLWQSQMGYNFSLNPILAIGSSTWQTACNWGGFSYHEVAWNGACTATDDVWDACLELNGSPNPTGPPFVPLLPCDLAFGTEYVNRLSGSPNCQPQPTTRQRRALS